MSIAHLFEHALTHRRKVLTDNLRGGYTEGTPTDTALRGRVVAATASEIQLGSQRQARVTHSIYVDTSTDVRMGDVFLYSGDTYTVTVPDIIPSVAIYKKILTQRTEKPS